MKVADLKWWQKAVFYQIYPRSFADGNGDGIGDLWGVIEKLDYLKDLGIDAIWLSPHYPSPNIDVGYDVADYTDVSPEYGNLEVFRRFLEEAHKRDIRLILDLVLNHTSDQHRWFQESRSSQDHPKHDWYIWKNPVEGGPPNNWLSTFGGSAWEYDEPTGQYYYHFFFKEQPDLNWRNPEVKQAMFDAARFWLNMGVDGFRLDAIGTLFEDPRLPNHESPLTQAELFQLMHDAHTPEQQSILWEQFRLMYGAQLDQPGIHELFKEFRQVIDEYDDRILVGETEEITYYGTGDDELHMVFNFPLMRTERMTAPWVRANQKIRLATLPEAAWPCNTLGNHDSPRVYSRYADGEHDEQIARASLALMLTLRGTPFLYYGEEIGMTDYTQLELDQLRDMLGVWRYHMKREIMGASHEEALQFAILNSRDRCRTPMQWKDAPNGGFSPPGASTWLPVNPNYSNGVNVADQEGDADSLLNFYKRMLRVRRATSALVTGDFIPFHEEDPDAFSFLRHSPEDGQTCLVIHNLCGDPKSIDFSGSEMLTHPTRLRLVFSTRNRPDWEDEISDIKLEPYEIYIAELVG